MNIGDIRQGYLDELELAVSQWVTGEPHPLLLIINGIQQESFMDGYTHAIETLKNNIKKFTTDGE